MASVVDICNLALSHVGDVADVQSISPPDGSVQAGFCSRFYPIALKAALEMTYWDFAMRRINLAQLATNPSTTWCFAYAVPDLMLNAIAVLSPCAQDDYSQQWGDTDNVSWWHPMPDYPNPADVTYAPQPFVLETQTDGTQILLTNVCDAVLRYTLLVTDSTQFSGLFVMALSYQLASMLAGPLIKGEAGMTASAGMLAKAQSFMSQAKMSDANNRHLELKQSVPWMAGR
jgi:hypothetical protein